MESTNDRRVAKALLHQKGGGVAPKGSLFGPQAGSSAPRVSRNGYPVYEKKGKGKHVTMQQPRTQTFTMVMYPYPVRCQLSFILLHPH